MKQMKPAAFLLIMCSQLFMLSCAKDSTDPPGASALTIVNAVVGSDPLVANFNGNNGSKTTDTLKYYQSALRINYGSFKEASSYQGATYLSLSQITDTFHTIYNGTFDLKKNLVYTLFMTGTIALTDTMFTTDQLPYHAVSDSSVGVRFVNLSPGSDPVNITLSDDTLTNEFSDLGYKNITGFKNYSAVSSVSSYTFQFRDAATNVIKGSFTMRGINNGTGGDMSTNNYRFRNCTIALIGAPDGTGTTAQKAVLINNY